jgi:hypothetical protein
MSKRLRLFAGLLGLVAVTLAGCATPSLQERQASAALYCAPIDMALSRRPEELLKAATTGDAQAQLSLSIVLAQGLNGSPADAAAADVWRIKAGQPRGVRNANVYVPGTNHNPGSVMLISVPAYDVPLEQLIAIDACIAALNSPPMDLSGLERIARGACGGPENYKRLLDAWTAARKPSHPKP